MPERTQRLPGLRGGAGTRAGLGRGRGLSGGGAGGVFWGPAWGAASAAGRSETWRAAPGDFPRGERLAVQERRGRAGTRSPQGWGAGIGPLVAIGRLFPSRGVLGCFQLSSCAPGAHSLDPFPGPRSWLLGAPGVGAKGQHVDTLPAGLGKPWL